MTPNNPLQTRPVTSAAGQGEDVQKAPGLTASEFEPVFRQAGVLRHELEQTENNKARAKKIGAFLSQHVGQEVAIEVDGRHGTATLRVREGRSRKTLYWFQVRWQDEAADEAAPSAETVIAATAPSMVLEPQRATEPAELTTGGQVVPNAASGTGNNLAW